MELQPSSVLISLQIFGAFCQPVGVNADTAYQHVYPLIRSKLFSSLKKLLLIKMGYLDRTQVFNEKSIVIFFHLVISQCYFCPDTTFKQFLVLLIELGVNGNTFRSKIFHFCPIPLLTLYILDMNLINELMAFALFYDSLCFVRLIRTNIVLLDGLQHCFLSLFNFIRVFTGAVTRQQELQYERRNIHRTFDLMQQVFTHHLSGKGLIQLYIKFVHSS